MADDALARVLSYVKTLYNNFSCQAAFLVAHAPGLEILLLGCKAEVLLKVCWKFVTPPLRGAEIQGRASVRRALGNALSQRMRRSLPLWPVIPSSFATFLGVGLVPSLASGSSSADSLRQEAEDLAKTGSREPAVVMQRAKLLLGAAEAVTRAGA